MKYEERIIWSCIPEAHFICKAPEHIFMLFSMGYGDYKLLNKCNFGLYWPSTTLLYMTFKLNVSILLKTLLHKRVFAEH
jgi:hypothetical protein